MEVVRTCLFQARLLDLAADSLKHTWATSFIAARYSIISLTLSCTWMVLHSTARRALQPSTRINLLHDEIHCLSLAEPN